MFGEFKVAHLLGVTRGNEPVFRHVETELTKQGYICFAPVIYEFDVYLEHKQMLKDMCYEKLLMTDICVVVTPWHIGKSTKLRIDQSLGLGKPVFVWDNGELVPFSKDSLIQKENGVLAFDSTNQTHSWGAGRSPNPTLILENK